MGPAIKQKRLCPDGLDKPRAHSRAQSGAQSVQIFSVEPLSSRYWRSHLPPNEPGGEE